MTNKKKLNGVKFIQENVNWRVNKSRYFLLGLDLIEYGCPQKVLFYLPCINWLQVDQLSFILISNKSLGLESMSHSSGTASLLAPVLLFSGVTPMSHADMIVWDESRRRRGPLVNLSSDGPRPRWDLSPALRLAEDTAPPVKSSCWEPCKLFRAEAVALRRGASRGNGWGLRRDGGYRPSRAKGTGVLIKLFIVWPIDRQCWTAGHCVWICKLAPGL